MSDTTTKDRYDRAIDELMQYAGNPAEFQNAVYDGWSCDGDHPNNPLFEYCSPTGTQATTEDGSEECGCLTQVKNGMDAYTPELTNAVRADPDVPNHPGQVTPESLAVFARWQRKLDAMFPGRNPEVTP